jgi:hypothetical protein
MHRDGVIRPHQREGGQERSGKCGRISVPVEPRDAAEAPANRGPAHSAPDRKKISPKSFTADKHLRGDADEHAKQ